MAVSHQPVRSFKLRRMYWGAVRHSKPVESVSAGSGMQCFDDALLSLYKDGKVSMEEALVNADSRANLEAKVNFG